MMIWPEFPPWRPTSDRAQERPHGRSGRAGRNHLPQSLEKALGEENRTSLQVHRRKTNRHAGRAALVARADRRADSIHAEVPAVSREIHPPRRTDRASQAKFSTRGWRLRASDAREGL